VNTNRLGPRRLHEPDRDGRRRTAPPPGKVKDQTGLYVGLAVGGGVLVLALVFAMSSGKTEPARVDRSADLRLKEDLETAQKMADARRLEDALNALEAAIQNPSYKNSSLLPKAKSQADQYRKQIAFEKEAVTAIVDFDTRITTSKADKTAMSKADAFWRECNELIAKYGSTAKAGVLKDWRQDLERWRGTNAQDVWQKDYNYTKDRIKTQYLDSENFSQAVKDWRRFAEPFDAADLKARVTAELIAIDKLSVAAATKLVQSAGNGAMARQTLEAAIERFMETEGQKIITQKLKTLQ